MPLADAFVRQVKPRGKPAGDSYADGGGMYLLVKPSGKRSGSGFLNKSLSEIFP